MDIYRYSHKEGVFVFKNVDNWHGLRDVRNGEKVGVEEFVRIDPQWALTPNDAIQKYIDKQRKKIEGIEKLIEIAEAKLA
jgi:hypothetical protein